MSGFATTDIVHIWSTDVNFTYDIFECWRFKMPAPSTDNGSCTFSTWRTIPEVIIGHLLQQIAGCRKMLHYCFRTWQSRCITTKECRTTTHLLCKSSCRSKSEVCIHTHTFRLPFPLESPRYTSCEFAMVECRRNFVDICHSFEDISTSV